MCKQKLSLQNNFKRKAILGNWTALILYEEAATDTLAVSVAADDAAKTAPPGKPPDAVQVGSGCSGLTPEVKLEGQTSNEVANPAKRAKSKFEGLPRLKFHKSCYMEHVAKRTTHIALSLVIAQI